MIIGFINSLLKSSIIFIIGVVYGIIISLSGLYTLFEGEVYGVSLSVPLLIAPLLVLVFIALFYKNDKIEQMKEYKGRDYRK